MERLLGFTYTKPSVAPINGVWDEMWQGTAEAGGGGGGGCPSVDPIAGRADWWRRLVMPNPPTNKLSTDFLLRKLKSEPAFLYVENFSTRRCVLMEKGFTKII